MHNLTARSIYESPNYVKYIQILAQSNAEELTEFVENEGISRSQIIQSLKLMGLTEKIKEIDFYWRPLVFITKMEQYIMYDYTDVVRYLNSKTSVGLREEATTHDLLNLYEFIHGDRPATKPKFELAQSIVNCIKRQSNHRTFQNINKE